MTTKQMHELRKQFVAWIGEPRYDRYVTLTLGRPGDGLRRTRELTAARLTERLRKWDAMMNRELLGKTWLKQPERRLYWFFTTEKLGVHPHLHGGVRFFTEDASEHLRQATLFDRRAEEIWKYLCPGATVDIQEIKTQEELFGYIAKDIGLEINYENFLVPDTFIVR